MCCLCRDDHPFPPTPPVAATLSTVVVEVVVPRVDAEPAPVVNGARDCCCSRGTTTRLRRGGRPTLRGMESAAEAAAPMVAVVGVRSLDFLVESVVLSWRAGGRVFLWQTRPVHKRHSSFLENCLYNDEYIPVECVYVGSRFQRPTATA